MCLSSFSGSGFLSNWMVLLLFPRAVSVMFSCGRAGRESHRFFSFCHGVCCTSFPPGAPGYKNMLLNKSDRRFDHIAIPVPFFNFRWKETRFPLFFCFSASCRRTTVPQFFKSSGSGRFVRTPGRLWCCFHCKRNPNVATCPKISYNDAFHTRQQEKT